MTEVHLQIKAMMEEYLTENMTGFQINYHKYKVLKEVEEQKVEN